MDESQPGVKTAGRNINNLRYANDTTLMAEGKEELNSLLMTVKEESEKAGLKLNIMVYWEDPEESDGEGGGRGGLGWGTHVNPWLIHDTVWQKPLQYCKVISLQLIKINEKKRNSTLKKRRSWQLASLLHGK